ncbi:unnamed protein product [Phytophthora fragariaefolia]|uniref:Unnamed protein product n=1 Tax=Phytophthora fragariaefolia TaxID=1490495 RepID=A0A9W6X4W3_9STRA|nr:unnamed protein product [Phytophthora fragariaefolia]
MNVPRKGIRSSSKSPAKKSAGAPNPKANPRDRAPTLAEAIEAIQSPGTSNTPLPTHSRRSRLPELPPDDRLNPRFACRDHSPGSPADPDPVLYSGAESDPHEVEGSHLAAARAPAAATASIEGETRPSPSQADPQAKAAGTASDSDTGYRQ